MHTKSHRTIHLFKKKFLSKLLQLTVFITSTFSVDLIINVLCTTCLFAIAEVKYVLFNIHINTVS